MRNRPFDERTQWSDRHASPTKPRVSGRSTDSAAKSMKLYTFQTGTLRTQTKFIKMNQDGGDFEIPVPWFLICHPRGNVVIDGGNAAEVAVNKRRHWGDVVDVYDPIMDTSENCVDQCRSVGIEPEDVNFVLQSHLHLDHSGAIGRFPNAQYIVQKQEYNYSQNPDWFAKGAYIEDDINKKGINWRFLNGVKSDNFDLFNDGTIQTIFSPGHSPGHQSFLIRLPNTGPVLLTIDAAYTMDHWNNRALPGLIHSANDAAHSVAKLRAIADKTGALVVTGHDPEQWAKFRRLPAAYYD